MSDVWVLVLKEKKNKETIELTFADADKREEFLLHVDRYEHLRNTLNK